MRVLILFASIKIIIKMLKPIVPISLKKPVVKMTA
jgi:hypothetical protein